MRDLEQCLGEDHRKISTWIANGWLQDRLQGTRRHDGNGNDIHRIREQDILNFIKNHPQEINLGKVDQTWFLDLVLLKGREVPEAKSPRPTGAVESRRGLLVMNAAIGEKVAQHGSFVGH